MKKVFLFLLLISVFLTSAFALDFSQVDAVYKTGVAFESVYDTLKEMLETATTDTEKADVLWRLSRVCVGLGDDLSSEQKKEKLAIYAEGESYGSQAKTLNSKCVDAYLWHCANAGRWGQTNGVMSSLVKLNPMMDDVNTIIDVLGDTKNSAAWYVLVAYYYYHPFKSTADGISYARVAVDSINNDDLGLIYYQTLAEMLWDRDWSTKKRNTEFPKLQKSWTNSKGSNTDKYKDYEGKDGLESKAIWSTNPLVSISDKEEAVLILKYCIEKYNSWSAHTPSDDRTLSDINKLLQSWT